MEVVLNCLDHSTGSWGRLMWSLPKPYPNSQKLEQVKDWGWVEKPHIPTDEPNSGISFKGLIVYIPSYMIWGVNLWFKLERL